MPCSRSLRSGPPEQTIEDPDKPAAVWKSTLTVRRAADGSLQELRWYERREGWDVWFGPPHPDVPQHVAFGEAALQGRRVR